MDITLYYTPKTRALRPRWLLEELGLEYRLEAIDLFNGEGQSKAYRNIHPLGAVPAIEIDGNTMIESGAICHWLSDKVSKPKLAPALDDPQRQHYEQWMFFAPGTLEPPAYYALLHGRILPEQQRIQAIVPWCMSRHKNIIAMMDEQLENREYLLGESFSTADIMIGSTLMWLPEQLQDQPRLKAYTERLQQRPAYQRACQ